MKTQLPSSSSTRKYHIFLSFRGETRKTFADHLYTSLCKAGFHTFRDNNDIWIGHPIKHQLDRAIEQCMISIIVLSKHYGYSKWCLNELLKILEQKKLDDHYIVFPIFYDVKPREVRNQKGSFQKAFNDYEKSGEHSMEKINQWRKALKKVSKIRGKVLQDEPNGCESLFIDEIVEDVRTILEQTGLDVASYAASIGSRIKDIDLWLKDPEDVMVGVISGKCGIGKTTVAKVAYNSHSARFEASSFLANIKEAFEQEHGVLSLQKQLLSDISKEEKHKIYSLREGIGKIEDAICGKRILLILDDVVQIEQVHHLIGKGLSFTKGSKIIITTSHVKLPSHLTHKTFRIKQLDDHESLRLFSWHAFSKFQPMEGYLEHSHRVVQHCKGVPIALQVMGSSLAGKTSEFWISALEKLEAIPDQQIHKALEVSYKLLHEDSDQRLFLTIASSFVGKDKDDAVELLKKCDFYSKDGMQNLIDRSLIGVDEDNKLLMHPSVLDMARAINSQETIGSPAKNNLHNSTGAKTDTITREGTPLYKSNKRGKRKHLEDYDEDSMPPDVKRSKLFKRLRLGFFSLFEPTNRLTKFLRGQYM